jgi:hypothetical protein
VAHRKLAIFRRRLFTAVSVLSLLLFIATLALWVRSYWRFDRVNHVDHKHRLRRLENLRGHMEIAAVGSSGWAPGYSYVSSTSQDRAFVFGGFAGGDSKSGSFLGFGYASIDLGPRTLRAIAVPHWFLALLFAILPALHLRSTIRSRRLRRVGHCPRCGYDLRATPARCPECGLAGTEARRHVGT